MSGERVAAFKQEVDALQMKAVSDGRERMMLRVGVFLLVLGPGIAFGAFMSSTSLGNVLDQNELIVLGLASVCVSLAGVAVFLRYSLGRLLRFWLLRQIYEGQEHVERLATRLGK
jgi:hypothetical protein